MIRVTMGTNVKKISKTIDRNKTLKQALEIAAEEIGLDYSMGQMTLDGAYLKAGDLDKTFADFGIGESCYLLNVAKTQNA